MRAIVIGAARSGKTTFGRALARGMKTVCTDTSEGIVVFESKRQELLREAGVGFDEGAWDNHRCRPGRKWLVAAGDALKVAFGPTILGDYCFDRGNVCVGVRRHDEAVALVRKYPDVIFFSVVRDSQDFDPDDNFDVDVISLQDIAPVVEVKNDLTVEWLHERGLRHGETYGDGSSEPVPAERRGSDANRLNRLDHEVSRLWRECSAIWGTVRGLAEPR